MRRLRWTLTGGAVLLAVAATAGVVVISNGSAARPAASAAPASTARVDRGTLSAKVSINGTLTYRARRDGSPYSVINQARGTYTELPEAGVEVNCGGVLYRVDDHPVLLLCGTVPAYRDLHQGDVGSDVRQLNQNLRNLDPDAGVDPDDNRFTDKTQQALGKLQQANGFDVTGQLHLGDVVFLPASLRIAKVSVELGGSAQSGASVLQVTSDTIEVQVALEPLQQGEVRLGDHVWITLPGNQSVMGKVDRIGRVAEVPVGQNGNVGSATIPAYISLDEPGRAGGLDQAPVVVDITTDGVEDVLSVPVTAIVGKSGGGFAVEAVREGGRREFVAVELGLFDTTAGRVEVKGGLSEGDQVVVPSL